MKSRINLILKTNNYNIFIRRYSSLPTESKVLRFYEYGEPNRVLKLETEKIPTLKDSEVLLKMIGAPIHPADLNTISGTYGKNLHLPAVPGIEGVGEVIAVGSSVSNLVVSDWVVPAKGDLGTWRTHLVASEKDLIPISNQFKLDLGYEKAATISVNPVTAHCLLHNFVKLEKGDVIIQNAGNSAVATFVAQKAEKLGVKTITVIRARDDYEEIVEKLKQRGSYMVVHERFVQLMEFKKLIADLPKPKLALDAVGGANALELARHLGPNGTMVTYGGLSRKPIQIPSSLLIFKNIQLRGFWLSQWIEENGRDKFAELINIATEENSAVSLERHRLSDFEAAFNRQNELFRERKIVFALQK